MDSLLIELASRLSKEEQTYLSPQAEAYDNPEGIVRFAREVLRIPLTGYQAEILRDLLIYGREAVRGPHGLGKTAMAATVILWGITVPPGDVKVVTTASAWRQLIHFTWPEVRKWAARADWTKLGIPIRDGKELLERGIKLRGREAFPVASDVPALIEGAHASTIVYVLDEAKAIPAGSWDAVEGAFSTAGSDTPQRAYAFAISTPGDTSGRFYDIHKRKPGYEDWHSRHVTLEEAIAAGRVSREWALRRKKQWGEKSAAYQNRVLGNFAEAGTDVLIPLAWVEAAIDRWLNCNGRGRGKRRYGVDVARFGDDMTVIARVVGNVVEVLFRYGQLDTMQTTGKVIQHMGRHKNDPVQVDVIGIGAGVVDRLRELGYRVGGVNVGESAKDEDGEEFTDESGELVFANLRSYLWWMLRERLDPDGSDPLALPPDEDDRLIGDLTAPRWGTTSAGRIKVESKDDLRKRIGRSTDDADAVALALSPVTSNRREITPRIL